MPLTKHAPYTGDEKHPVYVRAGLFILVFVGGLMAMAALSQMKEPPVAKEAQKIVLAVEGTIAHREDLPTILHGFGTARSHRRTSIVPQVSGKIVALNPVLEAGNIVHEGEMLIEIERADYELALEQTEADVAMLQAVVERLERQHVNDLKRLEIAKGMKSLSMNEVDRIEALVRDGGAESRSRLDTARMSFNKEENNVELIEKDIALFEPMILEAKARLKSALARREKAKLDLSRTTIRAPYTARIEKKMVELFDVVMSGQSILEIVDDTSLEIPVSLDSREVSKWLDVEIDPQDAHWFKPKASQIAHVYWSESQTSSPFQGKLVRIEHYDSMNRTFDVVVAVENTRETIDGAAPFPLADGMFCRLEIPGKIAHDVIAVPRESVDSRNTVLLAVDGKMKMREVQVARFQGNFAYISEGIQDGDIVLTSRPAIELDGTSIDVQLSNANTESVVSE